MLTVRTARHDDLDAVVELWRRSAGPTRRAGQRPEAEIMLQHDPDALILAELDGDLLGTLIVGWDGWRCHLYRMAVDDTVRRQGIGRALLQRGLERAASLGAARVDAMVDLSNHTAIVFWEHDGFDVDGSDGRWSLMLERAAGS